MKPDLFNARSVVLVEGVSDRVAVEALAQRYGRDLGAEEISVLPMGGATNIGTFLELVGPAGLDLRLSGLCDAGEEHAFRQGLERAGIGSRIGRADMERLGFFVCDRDLEDELIRALGPAEVEKIVETQGDLRRFRTLQKQAQWRGRSLQDQLRRFMGSGGRRKIVYAPILVEALELAEVPRPLAELIAHL